MLVLTRKKGQEIVIDGGRIIITMLEIRGDKARLGITADRSITVHRSEIHDKIQQEPLRSVGG